MFGAWPSGTMRRCSKHFESSFTIAWRSFGPDFGNSWSILSIVPTASWSALPSFLMKPSSSSTSFSTSGRLSGFVFGAGSCARGADAAIVGAGAAGRNEARRNSPFVSMVVTWMGRLSYPERIARTRARGGKPFPPLPQARGRAASARTTSRAKVDARSAFSFPAKAKPARRDAGDLAAS